MDEELEREPFVTELWSGDLRRFFLHFVGDSVKTACILAGLYLFWELIALLRLSGYPTDLLDRLEKAHFVFMYLTLCVTGVNFLLKQTFEIWRKKNKSGS
jgi:hypothetical protein